MKVEAENLKEQVATEELVRELVRNADGCGRVVRLFA